MNAVVPREPAERSWEVKTPMMSASAPLVMNVLEPFSTYPSPFLVAVVCMSDASLPELGSVRPNAPSFSPEAMAGKNRARCSGDPKRSMVEALSEICVRCVVLVVTHTRAISSAAIANSV